MSTEEINWEIPLKPYRKYPVRCPMCADDRKKQITRSLIVYRDTDGMIRWQCYHPGCPWNTRQYAVDPHPEALEHVRVVEPQKPTGRAVEVSNEFNGDQIWWYRDEEGNPIYAVRRQNLDSGKIYTPVGISESGETMPLPNWPVVRGFYGQENIAKFSTVLVVEGEKARDAAQIIFPKVAVITWRGGASNISAGDWSRADLRDKVIYLWPDNDVPGRQVMRKILDRLDGCTVFWCDSSKFPHKSDLADNLDDEMIKTVIRNAVLIQGA